MLVIHLIVGLWLRLILLLNQRAVIAVVGVGLLLLIVNRLPMGWRGLLLILDLRVVLLQPLVELQLRQVLGRFLRVLVPTVNVLDQSRCRSLFNVDRFRLPICL